MKLLVITLTVLESLLQALTANTFHSDVSLSISASASATQPISYTGSLSMHDDKFMIDLLGIKAAYNGETLYMYQEATDEITLSHPSQEELMQVNPMMLIRAIVPVCNVTERQSKNTKETFITLTPKDKSGGMTATQGIKSVSVRVRNSDLMLLSAQVQEDNTTSNLSFLSPEFTSESVSFSLSESDYPGAYINDLR